MKKYITIITAVLFLICFSTASARADRKTREGFMIGAGAAILGAAIINGMSNTGKPQYTRQHSRPPGHYIEHRHGYVDRGQNPYHRQPDGYWAIERIWVEPVYEKKWNPAHYNRRGEWIQGGYDSFLIREGYYQEQKIWVRH